jgi:hypothetical protein
MSILADLIAPFLADFQRRLRPNTLRAYRADLMIAAAHFVGPLDQIMWWSRSSAPREKN